MELKRERDNESMYRSGSFLKWPQWLQLSQSKVWSFWASHMGSGVPGLKPPCTAFPSLSMELGCKWNTKGTNRCLDGMLVAQAEFSLLCPGIDPKAFFNIWSCSPIVSRSPEMFSCCQGMWFESVLCYYCICTVDMGLDVECSESMIAWLLQICVFNLWMWVLKNMRRFQKVCGKEIKR